MTKPLFDKSNLPTEKPQAATSAFVGKIVFDLKRDKEEHEAFIQGTTLKPPVIGKFVPPEVVSTPVNTKPKTSGPAPLFKPTGNVESEITEADRIKFVGFSNREIVKIKDMAETIDLSDRVAVLQYGQDLNKKLAKAVDDILEFARNNSFNSRVLLDVSRLQQLINFNPNQDLSDGILSIFKKKKTAEERINDVLSQIDAVARSIDQNVKFFVDMIPKLDELLDRSKGFHNDLLIAIAAGKDRVAVFKRRKLPKLEEQLQAGNNMVAQNARDELDIFNSFIKRLETLELTIGQNELTLAQIRMTQSTNVKMVENLSNMMTSLVPLWKQSLVSAISSNNFDNVQKNKDLLSKSICDIIPKTA